MPFPGRTFSSVTRYDRYLYEYMKMTVPELQAILTAWEKKSSIGRYFAYFNPLVDYDIKHKAIEDLIIMRVKPDSEVAKTLKSKLAQL